MIHRAPKYDENHGELMDVARRNKTLTRDGTVTSDGE